MLIEVSRNKTSKTRARKHRHVHIKEPRDAKYVLETLRAYDCPSKLVYGAAVDIMKTRGWASWQAGDTRVYAWSAFAKKEGAEDLRDSYEFS